MRTIAQLYRFGPFELDVRAGELRKYGTRIRLQEQPLRILTMLLARPREAVLRDEIQQALWPNQTVVEFDQGINAAIKRLRTALGDSAVRARYIGTLARRGYRFIGTLESEDLLTPAVPDAGELAGRTIGHYRVLEVLGRGGMGIVYRAEDLQLGRKVALKLLHGPARERSSKAIARFRREARSAAVLSHPNICTIFAVEDFGGEPAIAMELLEGETLAQRLARGPLPFEQVRQVATQLASALDAGRRSGIVHRDFKPANIMLTANGPKVLDFGLAKADRVDASAGNWAGVTQTGAILGTLNYMSPEQAQGKDASAASDVFAFGAVLYEMCTAEKAFPGENPAAVIAAILQRQPIPLSAARPNLPAALSRIVDACLDKDPERRPVNLTDAMRELDGAPDRVHSPDAPQAQRNSRPSRRLLLGLAGGGALLAAGWRVGQGLSVSRALPVNTLIYPPEGFVWAGGVALSPDGRQLAAIVAAKGRVRQLWVRTLASSSERILPGSEGASFPFWSPDSQQIGFFANRELRSAPALGGPIKRITMADGPIGGAWGSDGKILFGVATAGQFSLVDAAKGFLHGARSFGAVSFPLLPQWLPDGRRFLFSGADGPPESPEALLGSLDSTPPHVLVKRALAAQFAPPDFLLFLRDGNLMAQRFDWERLRPAADAFVIAGNRIRPASGAVSTHINAFSASANGVLAYRTGPASMRQRLAWHGRDGRFLRSIGEPSSYMELFLSRDGRAAVVNLGNANGNLGLIDLASNTTSQLTTERPIVYDGLWSPDSRTIAFQTYTPPKTRILTLTLGEPSPRLVLEDGFANFPDDWSPDGKWILAHKLEGKQSIAFLLAADGQSKGRIVFKAKGQIDQLQFSPDGHWLAYNSTESGQWEVYVASYPVVNKVTRVSIGGGCQPVWRADSKELFYLNLDGTLMSVDMQSGTPPAPGKQLFASRIRPYPGFAQYAADAAGQQFLMIEPDPSAEAPESAEPIHVMTDWAAQQRD